MLRETLFNVIQDFVPGALVLDAFAGTGALGIEALSRGAAHVTFVERDPRASRLISANLRLLGVENGYAIIRSDVDRPGLFAGAQPFDVILLDPPYADRRPAADLLERASGWLAPGGILVLEHDRRQAVPGFTGSLVRTRDLISGESALAFYRHRSGETGPAFSAGPSRR